MKKNKFSIPIYNYEVINIFIDDENDIAPVTELLARNNIPENNIQYVYDNIDQKYVDGAECFRNMNRKKFINVFYPFTSEKARIRTICHEKRHVEDRLMKECHIDDIETAAYLAGYLAEKML